MPMGDSCRRPCGALAQRGRAGPPAVPLSLPLLPLTHSLIALTIRAGDILLAQKARITNWEEFQASNNITGWDLLTPVCSWTGVTCNSVSGSAEPVIISV